MAERYSLEISLDQLLSLVSNSSVSDDIVDFVANASSVEFHVDPSDNSWNLRFETEQSPPESIDDELLRIFRQRVDVLEDLSITVTGTPDAQQETGSDSSELEAWVKEQWPDIKAALRNEVPMAGSLLEYARPTAEDGKLVVELANSQAVNTCRSEGFDNFIEGWINQKYGRSPDVVLKEGDFSETLKEDAEQIEREEQKEIEKQERRRKVKEKKRQSDTVVGGTIKTDPVPINEVEQVDKRNVTVEGEVVDVELTVTSEGKKNIIVGIISDRTDAIEFKYFLEDKEAELAGTEGDWLRIRGRLKEDNFRQSGDKVIFLNDANKISPKIRSDDAPEKRVELHCHSNMSALDAMTDIEDLVERAAYWDQPAIAVTDHGVAHSFPEAAHAAEEYGVKVIFGVEGYLIEDDRPLVLNGAESADDLRPFDSGVIIDCETTGISPHTDEIFHISALRLEDGEVADRFSSPVNPSDMPDEVLEQSPLDRDDVMEAPDCDAVFSELDEFIGDRPVLAYEADFVRNFFNDAGYHFDQPLVHVRRLVDEVWDPPSLSLNPLIEERFGNNSEHEFNAEVDVEHTLDIVDELSEELSGEDTVRALREMRESGDEKGAANHIILLAKNQTGLENLYRLISISHVDNFYRQPKLFRSDIEEHREGLIVGSACEKGEIFQSVIRGESEEQIKERMKFYDLIEIQPVSNNQFMLKAGGEFQGVTSEEDIEELTRTIHDLGKEMDKMVVGTGDVHFLDPEDEIFRRILQAAQEFSDADHQPPLYLRTTQEMIDEFSFLGQENALEVAVENPRRVEELCDEVEPIPDGFYPPTVEGAEEEFLETTSSKVHDLYGDSLPDPVESRLESERDAIVENQFSNLYVVASRLVEKSLDDDYLVGSRGSVGSSFTAYLMGITEVNPLPAHYRCENDNYVEFVEGPEIDVGIDLPEKDCPECGERLIRDGFNIPFEVFLGFEGDKIPDIDLNFSGEYQQEMFKFVQEMFGEEHVIRAGTINTVAEKTAGGFVNSYLGERNLNKRNAERQRLKKGLQGVKQTSGQHPGGMIIIPEDETIFRFTPINYPANDDEADFLTTHFDYHAMEEQLVKLDILGHDDPTQLRHLQEMTGIDPVEIPLDDPETLELFSEISVLGIDGEELGMKTGVLAVPEFGTTFVRGMVEQTRPDTFADLIRISGLSHGTDVWLNNAQDLIRNDVTDLKGVITCRDDIMNRLIDAGLPEKQAFDIMEDVRKGRGLDKDQVKSMKANDVPDWYIQSCQKIKYLFPKAHAAAYVTMAFRIAYFKVHHPAAFYASYFTLKATDLDARYIGTLSQVNSRMEELQTLIDRQEHTARDTSEYTALEVVKEAYLRGIELEPPRVSESRPLKFELNGDDNTLLAPYITTEGMGESVALSLREAVDERELTSIEDAENRTSLNQGIVKTAKEHGFFEGLPDTENMDMFSTA